MNRRDFISNSTKTLVTLGGIMALPAHASSEPTPRVRIDPSRPIARIPIDMMGLSYESTLLGDTSYFSSSNKELVELCRALSPSGNLRLGGNTSEFTYFKANDDTLAPAWSPLPTQPAQLTPITPLALRNLRMFLDATGWNCIYGLNLGTGTPERAAEEAAAATENLGPRLLYLQIGNEPNNYIRYKLRSNWWSEHAYLEEWLAFAKAILRRLPEARLAGPDMAAEKTWMQVFVPEAIRQIGQNLVALTDHFYASGPPTDPGVTLHALLTETKKIDREIDTMKAAGELSKRPLRMTEVNSCYLGGKPGVSDTMGSALWAGNLTLRLMASGFGGINFHGGPSKQIRASLGGEIPGDAMAKTAASDSYYTPIAGDIETGFTARPIFYGMTLAACLAGTLLLNCHRSSLSQEVDVYPGLCADGHSMRIAIFNQGDESRNISISTGKSIRRASQIRLAGPTVESSRNITLGGHSVGADGKLPAGQGERLTSVQRDDLLVLIPPFSAALVTIDFRNG